MLRYVENRYVDEYEVMEDDDLPPEPMDTPSVQSTPAAELPQTHAILTGDPISFIQLARDSNQTENEV